MDHADGREEVLGGHPGVLGARSVTRASGKPKLLARALAKSAATEADDRPPAARMETIWKPVPQHMVLLRASSVGRPSIGNSKQMRSAPTIRLNSRERGKAPKWCALGS